MWQIMWMLNLLPNGFWHFLTISSVAAIFAAMVLKRIPFVQQYQIALKIGGTVGLLCGIWFEGGIANEAKWQARVAEMEAKVAQAEQQSKAANDKLDRKSDAKVKVIQGKQIIVKQYIDREVTKYDNQCVIPKAFVNAHNQSAEQPK